MGDNGYITIKEASEVAGVNISTIYRNISNLQCKTVQIGAKKIKYVQKSDIESFFCVSGKENQKHAIASEVCEKKQNESMQNETNLKESMREVIEEFFEVKQSQLMKPLEEQALYRLGILENEVKHLRAEKETLIQENEILREQIKALPSSSQAEEKENQIQTLQKEKADLEGKINTLTTPIESVNQILMKNAHNLTVLQKCKSELMEKLKQKEQEKEEALKELEARLKAEAEEAQKLIVDAWKKELEQARKPWYRRIFS